MGLYYLAQKVVTQEKHVDTNTIRVITSQKATKLTALMASYTKQSHVRRLGVSLPCYQPKQVDILK